MTYSVTCLGDRFDYSLEGNTLRVESPCMDPVAIDLRTQGVKSESKRLYSAWFKLSLAGIGCGMLGLGVPMWKERAFVFGGSAAEWVLLGFLVIGVVLALTIGRLWNCQVLSGADGKAIVVFRDPKAGDAYDAFIAAIHQNLRAASSG